MASTAQTVEQLEALKSANVLDAVLEPSPFLKFRRRIFKHRSFLIGAAVLLAILLVALCAPLLAPHDPYEQTLSSRLQNPFWHDQKFNEAHLLGTDKVGRDYLSRLIYGSQISLLIGVSSMLISGLIGTTLGVIAGYFGGRVDLLVNFIINTRLAMPVFLVAMAAVVAFGASLNVVILVLGLFLWDRFAVVMRSITMQARDLDYVTAARALGCSTPYIIVREIFPNVLSSLTVVATVEMANAILLEAALSFLGFGVQAPTPSWGLMLNEAREYMFFSPWLLALPGACLFVLVLAINLFGDGLRDVTHGQER
ncbi:MAG: ABC transporter permease [Gammaproteobacteria bacterium]